MYSTPLGMLCDLGKHGLAMSRPAARFTGSQEFKLLPMPQTLLGSGLLLMAKKTLGLLFSRYQETSIV
jgi:hypothetical protein